MADLLPISAEWLAAYRAESRDVGVPHRECRDCRWLGGMPPGHQEHDCTHRVAGIMGHSGWQYFASAMRRTHKETGGVDCGPEARFWEPRP